MKRAETSKWIMRNKKRLLLIPLFFIPSLTLLVWLGREKEEKDPGVNSGLNTSLPDATVKNEENNKWSLYERAERDSLNRRNNPTDYSFPGLPSFEPIDSAPYVCDPSPRLDEPPITEERVYQKIHKLQQQLEQTKKSGLVQTDGPKNSLPDPSAVVDRLSLNNENRADPELEQLQGLMDKVLDIQHPERVKKSVQKSSASKVGFEEVGCYKVPTSVLGKPEEKDGGHFLGVETTEALLNNGNSIPAAIHGTQRVVSGGIVRLRLLADISVAGIRVPKSSFVFGTASVRGERLLIEINTVRIDNNVLPLHLQAYDIDGLPGVPIGGILTDGALKSSADNSLQTINMGTLDPSLKAQAATAGIQAAKNLLHKRTKLQKLTLKKDHQVLLK
jgi:conjugative transposon TraM protein